MSDLKTLQTQSHATFIEIEGQQVPASFGDDANALQALYTQTIICDRSHWGCIELTGADRIRYLHNQSTNDFFRLQPGQGCETVFTTSTGRTIDLVTAWVTEESVLLIVSPNRRQKLMQWLDRYIFPADQVVLKDLSDEMSVFSLIGVGSPELLKFLNLALPFVELHSHALVSLAETEARIAIGSGLASPGYTVLCPTAQAAAVWQVLTQAGAMPAGEHVWQSLRIYQGRPQPDQELTEDYNPLEARLWQTLSFEKGCYIGQETIARLNTYKGVKQELWGIELSGEVPVESVITLGDDKVGKVTSVIETQHGWIGLAYIRTKAGGSGLTVQVGSQMGSIVSVPFLPRSSVEIPPSSD